MVCPSERLAGATRRGHTMAPEGQRPSQWRCLTKLPREMYAQPIVHKALSRGIIRKSACILAEITIWKSQLIFLLVHQLQILPVRQRAYLFCHHRLTFYCSGSSDNPASRYQPPRFCLSTRGSVVP